MNKIITKTKNLFEIWVFILIITVFSLVMPVFANISIKNGISFLIFQIGGIFIPGMAAMLLLGLRNITKLEFLVLSYAAGYGINIISYYITAPFGLQNYMKYLILLLALIGLVIIALKYKKIEEYAEDRKGSLICAVFLTILLLIEMFAVCAANFYPPNVKENILYHDMLYWIGNTITLKNGYPVISFREYPKPYTYHFFSSMQLAVISLTTNIRPVILGFTFYFIQPVFFMITTAYIMIRRITDKRWLTVIAMIVLLFTDGKPDWTAVYYISHLFVVQFGFEISYGFYMLFFWCMLSQLKENKFNIKLCVIALFTFILTMGTKSSFGAMALCAAGIICMWWLWKKQIKQAFAYGIPILLCFVFLYMFVVNLGSSDQPESSIIQTFLNAEPSIFKASAFLRMTRENLLQLANGNGFLLVIMNIINGLIDIILSQYCIFIPFFYFLFMRIFKTGKWEIFDSTCLAVIIVGSFITLKWGNPDSSVVYFLMASYAPTVLFCIKEAECMQKRGDFRNKYRAAAVSMIFLCLCIFGLRDAYYHEGGFISVKAGMENKKIPDKTANGNDRAFISSDDYAAYEWIRCNTQGDALVSSNFGLQRGRSETSRHSRVPGVFTERYVIGNEETDSLFYDLDYSRIQDLKEMGIAYIIYNRIATPDFSLPEEVGEAVYENATNIIYKIK